MKSKIVFIISFMLCCNHLVLAQQFRLSDGLYRLPYSNGTNVQVITNVWNHAPKGCFDLQGVGGIVYPIVAAAGGWIRAIRDHNNESCYDPCCGDKNNFIVLEHPNGEWSSYIHLRYHSIRNLGHAIGDWVNAGEALGVEGDVGCASGDHLHFELSRPDSIPQWSTYDGVLRRSGKLLNPVFCNVPTGYLFSAFTYTASDFNFDCPANASSSATVTNLVLRADNDINSTNVFNSDGTGMFRAGSQIVLSPGFTAPAGVMFNAQIKSCNQQN